MLLLILLLEKVVQHCEKKMRRDLDRKLVSNSPKLEEWKLEVRAGQETDTLWAPVHRHSKGTRARESSMSTAMSEVIQQVVERLPT